MSVSALQARVTFVVYSLTCGGMERVVSLIVNYWAARERQVSLITIAGRSGDFFELHERVPRIALGLDLESHTAAQRFGNNWRRVLKLRKALRSTAPDAVVSFGDVTNVLTILSSLGLGVPVIVSERTDPRRHPLAPAWQALRRITYPRADAVVMQTRALTDWCREFLPMDRVRAIANPVDCSIRSEAPQAIDGITGPFVVAMGALRPEKGFDLLLEAYALLEPNRWPLVIVGDGPQRGSLEALAARLGIASSVHFLGYVRRTRRVLCSASLFVLPSRYEGFPNALLEAMCCGLPVISFDCDSGPREIIASGCNGLLLPPEDTAALASALDVLMHDEALRRTLGAQGRRDVEQYSYDRILPLWEALIAEKTA